MTSPKKQWNYEFGGLGPGFLLFLWMIALDLNRQLENTIGCCDWLCDQVNSGIFQRNCCQARGFLHLALLQLIKNLFHPSNLKVKLSFIFLRIYLVDFIQPSSLGSQYHWGPLLNHLWNNKYLFNNILSVKIC